MSGSGAELTFLFANPLLANGAPSVSLNPSDEVKKLVEKLSKTEKKVKITALPATIKVFSEVVGKEDGNIMLHFAGHGSQKADPGLSELIFEHSHVFGQGQGVSAQSLRRMVCRDCPEGETNQRSSVRFVFISACYSLQVGKIFAEAGIPHVIAVAQNDKIEDRAARDFCERVYYGLLHERKTVRAAYHAAKTLVAVGGSERESEKYVLLPEDGNHDVVLFPSLPNGQARLAEPLYPRCNNMDLTIKHSMLFGRNHLLQAIVHHLVGEARIVGITGAEGVGKTLLAKAVAQYTSLRGCFPDGVFFVDCSSCRTVMDVSRALCKVLKNTGVMDSTLGWLGPADVAKIISARKCLVVLDCCHRLMGEEARSLTKELIGPILREDRSRVMICSRMNMRVLCASLENVATKVHKIGPLDTGDADTTAASQIFYKSVPRSLKDELRPLVSRDQVIKSVKSCITTFISATGYPAPTIGMWSNSNSAVLSYIDNEIPADAFIKLVRFIQEEGPAYKLDMKLEPSRHGQGKFDILLTMSIPRVLADTPLLKLLGGNPKVIKHAALLIDDHTINEAHKLLQSTLDTCSGFRDALTPNYKKFNPMGSFDDTYKLRVLECLLAIQTNRKIAQVNLSIEDLYVREEVNAEVDDWDENDDAMSMSSRCSDPSSLMTSDSGLSMEPPLTTSPREPSMRSLSTPSVLSHAPSYFESSTPIVGMVFSDKTMFGRESYIESIRDLLLQDSIRMVTVVGKGGIGKTTILSEFCSRVERGDISLSSSAQSMSNGACIGASGIMYIAARGEEPVRLESIFQNFGRMVGGRVAEELQSIWEDNSLSVDSKCAALLERISRPRGSNILRLVAIDNIEDQLTQDFKIRNDGLRVFLEKVLTTPCSVKVVTSSRQRIDMVPAARTKMREVHVDEGLSESAGADLLRSLDPVGELGLQDADPDILTRASRMCRGIPHALESVAGILAADPTMEITDLLEDTETFSQGVVKQLLIHHCSLLSDTDKLVLETLAVFKTPVRIAAVQSVLPQVNVSNTLNSLVHSYFVSFRRGVKEYSIHSLDRDYHYSQIDDQEPIEVATYQGEIAVDKGTDADLVATKRKLYHRACARYYSSLPVKDEQKWKKYEDVEDFIHAFNHWYHADEMTQCILIINGIDFNFLSQWGYSHLVCGMREKLMEMLTSESELGLFADNCDMLGCAYIRRCLYDDAIRVFEMTLSKFEKTRIRDIYGNLGRAHLNVGNVDQTRMCFQVALNTNKILVWSLWLGRFGELERMLGNYDFAIQCFEEAKKKTYDRWIATHCSNIGEVAGERGDFGVAESNLATALQSSIDTKSQIGQAICHYRMGEMLHRKARHLMMECDHSESWDARFSQAQELLACAYRHYDNSLKFDLPNTSYRVTCRLGMWYRCQGRDEEALEMFKNSIARCEAFLSSSTWVDAHYSLVLALLCAGEQSRAEEVLASLLERWPYLGPINLLLCDMRLLHDFMVRDDKEKKPLPGAYDNIRNMLEEAQKRVMQSKQVKEPWRPSLVWNDPDGDINVDITSLTNRLSVHPGES